MSPSPAALRPTPLTKKIFRLVTFTVVVFFLLLVFFRHSLQRPGLVRFKSPAELAKIPPSQDSYPCILVERSGPALRTNVTTCFPALHNESAVEQYEVDLRSGRFTLRNTDLFVADSMPLALTRGYRLWDENSRAFGIGGNHPYDIFPYGNRFPYTYMELLLGDGIAVHYDRISEGTSYVDDVNEHWASSETVFKNSRIAWNRDHWDMTFRDGTLYRFPEAYRAKRGVDGALVGMRNSQGAEIRFVRDALHNLTSITSPSGHWIHFVYDHDNRIAEASDDAGDAARYSYDKGGRLVAVRKDNSILWEYAYDVTGLIAVRSSKEMVIENRYATGRLSAITIGKTQTYRFEYLFDLAGRVVETRISDPRLNETILKF